MKLAWLIYRDSEDIEENTPDIVFEDPSSREFWRSYFRKVVPIVYMEIKENEQ